MNASSESGECASLISVVCCADLDVAVVPDMEVRFLTAQAARARISQPGKPPGFSSSETRNRPGHSGFGRKASGGGAIWKREGEKAGGVRTNAARPGLFPQGKPNITASREK